MSDMVFIVRILREYGNAFSVRDAIEQHFLNRLKNFLPTDVFPIKRLPSTTLNRFAYALHPPHHEARIVNGQQQPARAFAGFEQMMQVGARKVFAGITVAIGVDRVHVLAITGVF